MALEMQIALYCLMTALAGYVVGWRDGRKG